MLQRAGKAGKLSVPEMDMCLSPALPLADELPSFGAAQQKKGFQKAWRPKRSPTPRGPDLAIASFSGAAHQLYGMLIGPFMLFEWAEPCLELPYGKLPRSA